MLGPRLVGKTTGVKLLINRLLKRVRPEKIMYVSCEIFPDYNMLSQVLIRYLKISEKWRGTSYIFLDEATALKDWWKAVKPLIDAGVVENTVITVTGSSSLKVRRDVELFPGRRGKGVTIKVMPLSFSEYVRLYNIEPELHPGGDRGVI